MVLRGDITIQDSSTLKASRFNVRVADGEYLRLYNSYTGKISKFTGEEAEIVDELLKVRELEAVESQDENRSGLIQHLQNKGFLVKNRVNEFQLATAQKYNMLAENRMLQLIILPNEDCNFRCTYCYEDFLKSEMKESVQQGILNFLEKNVKNYSRLLISWFGGEPLKSFDVIKRMSAPIKEICAKYNVQYHANITTNGYLLNSKTFEELLDMNVRSFQITLDGTAETHDSYRVGRFGEKTFDTIFSNLLKMKQSDKPFNVVLRSNINQEVSTVMDNYISLVSSAFVEDPRFMLHFVPIQNLKGEQTADIHLCDTKMLFPFYEKAKEKGFNFDFYKQYLRPGGSECYASSPSSCVIGSDGMIYKCTVAFNNPMNHVGDILENGEMVIDEEKWSLWVTGGVNEDASCTKCFFRPSCQGNACPLERIETGATPCPPVKKSIKKYITLVSEDYAYEPSV